MTEWTKNPPTDLETQLANEAGAWDADSQAVAIRAMRAMQAAAEHTDGKRIRQLEPLLRPVLENVYDMKGRGLILSEQNSPTEYSGGTILLTGYQLVERIGIARQHARRLEEAADNMERILTEAFLRGQK